MGKSFNHSHNSKTDIKVKKVGNKEKNSKQTFKLHNKTFSLRELDEDDKEI